MNQFVETYQNLLDGVYYSFDRIAINCYFEPLQSPGGFLTWFQRYRPGKPPNKNELLRFAYRAARRIYAFAAAKKIKILTNVADERKHDVAETYLKNFDQEDGVFLIMKVREMTPIYEAPKNKSQVHLEKKMRYVNYYYFHIKDKKWGHVTIGVCPHPPFTMKIILNAHDWLAYQADRQRLDYHLLDNCLIDFTDARAIQKLADTLSEGQLLDVCRRWAPRVIMSLTTEEIRQSHLGQQFFFFQAEYCFNMLFHQPRHLDWVYQHLIDNTRTRLRPAIISTIFGKDRRGVKIKSMSIEIENPEYDLTIINIWFGKNRVKIYDKGDRVLRVEVTINQPKTLGLKKSLAALPDYRRRMQKMIETFLEVWQSADQCRITAEALEDLQAPVIQGEIRLPGISLTNRRLLTVLSTSVEFAKQPDGFAIAEFYPQVVDRLKDESYTKSQLTYDLRKLRAKGIVEKVPKQLRYQMTKNGIQKAVGLLIFRNEIIQPVLSPSSLTKRPGRPPQLSYRDQLYRNLQIDLEALCIDYGLKKAA